jgi:hypothetical protein
LRAKTIGSFFCDLRSAMKSGASAKKAQCKHFCLKVQKANDDSSKLAERSVFFAVRPAGARSRQLVDLN